MEHVGFDSKRLMMRLIKKDHAERAITVLQSEELYTYLPKNPPSLDELEKQFAFWEKQKDSPGGDE